MADPISYVKSSGGEVDAEFVDDSSYSRLEKIERSMAAPVTGMDLEYDYGRVWSTVSHDYFSSSRSICSKPTPVTPGSKIYVTAYTSGAGMPAVVFFNSATPTGDSEVGSALPGSTSPQFFERELIEVPAGATHAIFNGRIEPGNQNTHFCPRVYDELNQVTDDQEHAYRYAYREIKGLTWNRGCWSDVIDDIFDISTWHYTVIDPSDLETGVISVVGGGANADVPIVVLFPEFGNDYTNPLYKLGTTDLPGSQGYEPADIYDIDTSLFKMAVVSMPVEYDGRVYQLVRERDVEDGTVVDGGTVSYRITGDTLTVSHPYGDKTMSVTFGKRGPNDLPDFKTINNGTKNLYSSSTDWHGPFIVSAKGNADGDDTGKHTFTGGNHNYANTGTMDQSATGRNLALTYYADGEKLSNGDSGIASVIEIVWVNRVQAYNTRKSDGSGREVLEERHRLTFDGTEWKSYVEIEPLEDVHVQTYYGFQATSGTGNWPTVQFIGGANREAFTITDYVQSAPDSAGRRSNKLVAYSDTDLLEIEVDRSFDMGAGTAVQPTTNGWRTSNNKLYSYLVDEKDMSAGEVYGAVGYWRFRPVTHEGV